MTRLTGNILASAAFLSLAVLAIPASAAETTEKTTFSQIRNDATGVVTQTQNTETQTVTQTEVRTEVKETVKIPDGTKVVNFKDLDANGDGTLSRDEVGMRLFKLYDTDGNQVIDNIEYKKKSVITVQPVERETTVSYYVDGASTPEKREVSEEEFMRDTMLAHFDQNKNGLSPQEFLQRDFLRADVNRDKVIDAKEWLGAYNEAVDKKNKEKAAYNR